MIAISTYPLNRINLMRVAERLRQNPQPIGLEFFFDELPSHHAYYYQFRMEELLELGLVSMHGPMMDCDPLAEPGSVLWDYTLSQYERCFELAEQLGLRYLVYQPSHQLPLAADHLPYLQDRLGERLTLFEDLAEKHHLTLRVKNTSPTAAHNPLLGEAAFSTLMQAHPRAQILLDVGHAHLNGWQLPLFIPKLANRIGGYHLHDNHAQTDEHLPIGCGTVAWSPLWHSIATFTPHADLILQYSKSTAEEQMLQDCYRLKKRLSFETHA